MVKPTGVSFLLGSGFSRPAGYPLVSELNSRFAGLRENQFTIHSDGSAWFHEGKPNPNDWFMHKEDRVFAEGLIAHFCAECGGEYGFHYEAFYDWYKGLREQRTHQDAVIPIARDLGMDPADALFRFDLTFNQLLAQPLRKWYPEIHYCRGLPISHAKFLDLVERTSKHVAPLHSHTLNHDLFFESLASTDAIQGQLADGFSDSGSPFYGRLTVPLEPAGSFSYRIKITDFFRETGQGSELHYEQIGGLYHPDFLSGTTYKRRKYSSTPYYKAVFEHFEENLRASAALIVVGYGWGDTEINSMVETWYRPDEGRLIFDIDVVPPRLPGAWGQFVRYFPGGTSDFDVNGLMNELDDVL